MISTKTAQVAIYCGLFILVLLFFSFDLALTVTVSAYLLFTSKRYIPIFVIAIAILLLDVLFQYFDINFRFISDLSLDAYILFLTAVFLYLKSQKRFAEFLKKIGLNGKKLLAKEILSALGISLVFSLLFLPLVGFHFSAILGYLSFSYITKQSEGKNAYTVALIFLIFSPFFIMAKKDNFAESFAIVSFYFLITGTVQEIINLVRARNRIKEKEAKIEKSQEKEKSGKEEKREEEGLDILTNRNIISMKGQIMRFPKISFPHINPRLLLGGVVVIAIAVLVYFFFPRLSKIRLSISIPKVKIPPVALLKKSPSPTASPSATLVPTVPPPTATVTPSPILKVTTESAKLKIFVQNGTDVTGLAASTSAKLKKAGFINIKIGNAETQDYTHWQLTAKKETPDLSALFKNILELSDLKAKEATIPAGFDILIIAGFNK